MSLRQWEKKVLKAPAAIARVAEIEEELRLAAGLTALREQAGFSQRELARRMGVSQPRVAAIEQSRNVTIDVLEQYADAIGGKLEVTVVKGKKEIPLMTLLPVPSLRPGTTLRKRRRRRLLESQPALQCADVARDQHETLLDAPRLRRSRPVAFFRGWAAWRRIDAQVESGDTNWSREVRLSNRALDR